MSTALVDSYLKALVAAGGSDLHMRAGGPPRIRVHGRLDDLEAPALSEWDTESVARAVIRPHLLERFERGEEVDFAYTMRSGHRFRVNAYRQRDSVALVFRKVVNRPSTVAELSLPDTVRRFADEQRGLVLVCGPTGSGKTTTLAAMLDWINQTKKAHVVTIEDPVEVMHTDNVASISQRELGADTASYAAAMRSVLRQDPDVILVGEMRDTDTVRTAMAAAETGHLVLSTLHTTNASETINRIIEFFPAQEQRQVRLMLAGVLQGTVCQRLIPTADGEGRVPATEIMVVNGRVQTWIVDPESKVDVQEIIADGDYYGMHTFDQSILDLYEKGEIDLRSAFAAASNPHDLNVMMRQRGLNDRSRVGDEIAQLVANLAESQLDAVEAEPEPASYAQVEETPSPPLPPPVPVQALGEAEKPVGKIWPWRWRKG